MEIKCEWLTCTYNKAGKCLAEIIELVHSDNEDQDYGQPGFVFHEGLNCRTYKYNSNFKDRGDH